MAQFTARSIVDATPEQVLEVLTDPEEIRSWSPIPVEVDDSGRRRLHSGSVARVTGSLAGRRVGFDVAVHAADADGLELSGVGPMSLDARYGLSPVEGGSGLTVSIGVRGGSGLIRRLLATATSALVQAGALNVATGVSRGRPSPLPGSSSRESDCADAAGKLVALLAALVVDFVVASLKERRLLPEQRDHLIAARSRSLCPNAIGALLARR